MFLCKDCHDVRNHPMAELGFGISYGKCEGCGKEAPCIDCHIQRGCISQSSKEKQKDQS